MLNYKLPTVLLTLLFASPASANGGPVDWTDATAQGGIFPLQEEQIALQSEDVHIRLEKDGKRFSLKATYTLNNSGARKKILYGVPLIWPSYMPDEKKVAVSAVAQTVKIDVDGKSAKPCVISAATATHPPPVGDLNEVFEDDEESQSGWCIAELDMPAGKIILVLEYQGMLRFTDMEFSKSAMVYFGARTLYYPFFPAGFWRGDVKKLNVTLETGIFAPFVKVKSPAKFKKNGAKFAATFENIDLKTFAPLVVEIAPDVLEKRELTQWNAQKKPRGVTLKASSVLSSGRKNAYATTNMLDGNLATAWCEGVADEGKGEWIEVEVIGKKPYCSIEGFALLPGYAKSVKHWQTNGRIAKVRVSPCGKPNVNKIFTIAIDEEPALGGVKIPLMEGGSYDSADSAFVENTCFRFEIIDVKSGTKYQDTCISEFAPIINCG